MPDLTITRLCEDDLFAIECQPSQRVTLGLQEAMTAESADVLVSQQVAWAARDAGRLIACFGIAEQFTGAQGLGWSILAEGIGAAHLTLTRFMRSQIANSGLARVELIARAPDLEQVIASHGGALDSGQLVALAMADPTPEMRWAVALGMRPAHLLRRYGAASESHMLFEFIGGDR